MHLAWLTWQPAFVAARASSALNAVSAQHINSATSDVRPRSTKVRGARVARGTRSWQAAHGAAAAQLLLRGWASAAFGRL